MDKVAIIHGKAYDLEAFGPHHPGGPIIHYGTGKTTTKHVKSYMFYSNF